MDSPKHYHPLLATLHWVVAALVLLNLYLGLVTLGPGRGDSTVPVHILAGIAILALVIVRFVVRMRSKKPADATAGNRFLDTLGKVVHYALYIFLLAITIIGLVFAVETDRLQSAFSGAQPEFSGPPAGFTPGAGFPGGALPGGFSLLTLHLYTAYGLLALIGLHVAAALYHQFIRRDNLIARMWFGKT